MTTTGPILAVLQHMVAHELPEPVTIEKPIFRDRGPRITVAAGDFQTWLDTLTNTEDPQQRPLDVRGYQSVLVHGLLHDGRPVRLTTVRALDVEPVLTLVGQR